MSRELHFYTDGAYSSKTQMGGWASVCLEDGSIIDEKTGYEPYTTNNRMEIIAVLSAMENANTIETWNTTVKIYSDSAYVVNIFNQQWYLTWMKNGWTTSDKQAVKNQDLLRRLVSLYIKLKKRLNIVFVKVPAHSGNRWNEYVNCLAVRARSILED